MMYLEQHLVLVDEDAYDSNCSSVKSHLEQEQEAPGLGSLAPLSPQLQPLICFLYRHELVPPLWVLVRMVLPCQLPTPRHMQQP